MKRFLSSLLCLVLFLGMMTIPAAADRAEREESPVITEGNPDASEAVITAEESADEIGDKAAEKITISGSKYVAKGKKITLKATVSPESGSGKVTWKSGNRKIATVSSKGVVKGLKPGKVKITATLASDKKVKKTVTIEVKAEAVSGISITGAKDLDLTGEKTVTLKAEATPAEAAQSFEWKSSDRKVATVNAKGKVTAKRAGTVSITAKATDGSGTEESVSITVREGGEEPELFRDMAAYRYQMSSGAGGWSDDLVLKADGTYVGKYHDSDMGDTGKDYPDGTVYIGTYKGKLGNIQKVSQYLYKVEVIYQNMDERPQEEIKDGVRYVSADGGFKTGDEVFICVPGTPKSALSEDVWNWYWLPRWAVDATETDTYGIFLEDGTKGFFGYAGND